MPRIPQRLADLLPSVKELCDQLGCDQYELTKSTRTFRDIYVSPLKGADITKWNEDDDNLVLRRMAEDFLYFDNAYYARKHWPRGNQGGYEYQAHRDRLIEHLYKLFYRQNRNAQSHAQEREMRNRKSGLSPANDFGHDRTSVPNSAAAQSNREAIGRRETLGETFKISQPPERSFEDMPRTFASINGSGQKPDSTSRSTALAGPSRIANEGSVDSTDGNEELPVGGIGFRQKRTLSELSYSPSEPSRPRKIFRSGGEQTDSQPVHPACRACRRAHQKCDRKKPICAPCYKNKIDCIWPQPGESRAESAAELVRQAVHKPTQTSLGQSPQISKEVSSAAANAISTIDRRADEMLETFCARKQIPQAAHTTTTSYRDDNYPLLQQKSVATTPVAAPSIPNHPCVRENSSPQQNKATQMIAFSVPCWLDRSMSSRKTSLQRWTYGKLNDTSLINLFASVSAHFPDNEIPQIRISLCSPYEGYTDMEYPINRHEVDLYEELKEEFTKAIEKGRREAGYKIILKPVVKEKRTREVEQPSDETYGSESAVF